MREGDLQMGKDDLVCVMDMSWRTMDLRSVGGTPRRGVQMSAPS